MAKGGPVLMAKGGILPMAEIGILYLTIHKSRFHFPKNRKGNTHMSNNNNPLNIPQAREAGSVGGQMVKTMYPIRTKFDGISVM